MGLQAITGIIMILIMASESKLCKDPPAPPANGTLSYLDDDKTAVKYDCDLGYKANGSEYSYCQHTGNWSNPAPSCVRACPKAPEPLENGDFGYIEGTRTIFYTCNVGYWSVGKVISTCLDSGNWSNPAPSCVLCKDPPAPPANGAFSYTDDDKTAVKYNCDLGYKLEGNEYSLCQNTGDWNNRAPSCVHACPNAPVPLNNGDFTYDSWGAPTILYRCNVGYRLVGQHLSICLGSGEWSNPEPPTCVYACPNAPVPLNNGDFTYDSWGAPTIRYRCNVGYRLDGEGRSTCNDSGIWSNPEPPTCVHACPNAPVPLNNGDFTYDSWGAPTIWYRCNVGYRLVGQHSSICLGSGEWSNSAPSCVHACPNAPVPLNNGDFTYDSWGASTILYRCNVGYRLVGQHLSICLGSGEWSNSAPSCVPI